MKTQTTIITLLLATLLTGCGVKKEDHQQVLSELEETKQALEQSQSEVSTLKDRLTSAEKELARSKSELSAASSRASELTTEVERLKKQDTYAFTEAGRLLDSGDLQGALRAYNAFVRDFPSSPQASKAKEQLTLIERQIEAQRRELAARAERERQETEQRELAERVRSGNLTPYQWWPILRGKTMQQVKALLGTPGHTGDDDREWTYYDMAVAPNSGKKEWLNVHFRGGVVRGVSSQSLNSIIQD
jgi:DNA repair exonuclease SbcCD ATPase subunit